MLSRAGGVAPTPAPPCGSRAADRMGPDSAARGGRRRPSGAVTMVEIEPEDPARGVEPEQRTSWRAARRDHAAAGGGRLRDRRSGTPRSRAARRNHSLRHGSGLDVRGACCGPRSPKRRAFCASGPAPRHAPRCHRSQEDHAGRREGRADAGGRHPGRARCPGRRAIVRALEMSAQFGLRSATLGSVDQLESALDEAEHQRRADERLRRTLPGSLPSSQPEGTPTGR